MKTKTLFGLFALVSLVVLSLSFTSAATLATWDLTSNGQSTSDSDVIATSLTGSSGVGSITYNSQGASTSGWTTSSTLSSSDYYEVTIRPQTDIELVVNSVNFTQNASNNNMSYAVAWSKESDFSPSNSLVERSVNQNGAIGTNIVVSEGQTLYLRFFAYNADSSSDTWTLASLSVDGTINVAEQFNFCNSGEQGTSLRIGNPDVTAPGDDEEWNLLDEVEIEVDVDNDGAEDLEDIVVEMGLFRNGENYVGDLDFSSSDEEEQDIGDLDEGDDDTATFTFKVPADFEDGNYDLVFKAYVDGEENENCIQTNEISIDVQREDDEEKFIIVDDFTFPTEAVCGEEVSGSFTVYNVGDKDQDQILVRIFSSEFDISEEVVIREDVDQGDDKRLDFSFEIPSNLNDGFYSLNFETEYGYDDDDDTYDDSSEDTFSHRIRVSGCDGSTNGNNGNGAIGSVVLDSDAMAGKPLVVRATITNTGSSTANFVLSASGYQSWASLEEISERIVNLAPGASKSVTMTLNVNDDVSGTQSFIIESSANGNLETQEVEVFIDSDSNGFNLGGNSLIWIIGIINVVLIILIIVVAIRLAR